jgi:uncharacterized protein DUF4136
MKRLALSLLAVTLALPAFAYKVQTDYDHNVNFEQFHSYCWGHVKTSDPFYASRIRDRVNQNLQAKGWQLVTSKCDATIFATDQVHNQKQVETFYNGSGGGWGWGRWGGGGFGTSTTSTFNQSVGHLVLDIFSTKDKELVWRGMTDQDLSTNTDKNTKALDSDIDKMLKDFPPKGSSARGE